MATRMVSILAIFIESPLLLMAANWLVALRFSGTSLWIVRWLICSRIRAKIAILSPEKVIKILRVSFA